MYFHFILILCKFMLSEGKEVSRRVTAPSPHQVLEIGEKHVKLGLKTHCGVIEKALKNCIVQSFLLCYLLQL